MAVSIGSQNEWSRILSSSTIVVADFYADWCGPCKMIAPTFESLATKFSKPGKITFCKINTDSQQSIASAHGVRAMPTFLIFKSGSVIETIQGANPPALTAAVEKSVKLAGNVAPLASFKTPGRTLGGSGPTPPKGAGGGRTLGRPSRFSSFSHFNFFNVLLTFFGLYVVSLFSFDPYKAAENSDFNVHKPRDQTFGRGQPSAKPGAPGSAGAGAGARPSNGVRTLADLGGS
ncbi:thioredoxin-like protein [Truncatella angustata]|uniref:Thioredoxin-like protein n=1 Tax=Truncatella angustata TaxID=152316 RepID=A0A9P8REZ4_9PEZI|nr:thioredoxin-like protein [Truncatella angustata]KAH6643368.1 thioredoxin-like protein [Truncatella angustata]KAH8196092.1 hypothetical protein TruAng_009748 [Truncatella angustata]